MDLELIPTADAPPRHGDGHRDLLIGFAADAAGRRGRRGVGLRSHANLDVAPLDGRLVVQHELKGGVGARKSVDFETRIDRETEEIAMAMMHGDEHQTGHEEREGET
jgi:hypothetical protein